MKAFGLWLYRCLSAITDPLGAVRILLDYPRYLAEWRRYSRLRGAERLLVGNAYPCLSDRTRTSGIDAHYFYLNGWAMRRIVSQQPAQHVDVGSQVMFANLLAAVIPVTFVDYRPLQADIEGLTNRSGDILSLPFEDGTIASLSCLHVAEHIGLGRYGDPLNPNGTREACSELIRVLVRGGDLYFALPVGRPRVCFNAHRIHAAEAVVEYFSGLELVEFSGVRDDGSYVQRVSVQEFAGSHYACGMFWFRKR